MSVILKEQSSTVFPLIINGSHSLGSWTKETASTRQRWIRMRRLRSYWPALLWWLSSHYFSGDDQMTYILLSWDCWSVPNHYNISISSFLMYKVEKYFNKNEYQVLFLADHLLPSHSNYIQYKVFDNLLGIQWKIIESIWFKYPFIPAANHG